MTEFCLREAHILARGDKDVKCSVSGSDAPYKSTAGEGDRGCLGTEDQSEGDWLSLCP